jgi:predicted DNA binding protein
MDGPPLRQVTFRVEHNCPLARLSLELPGVELRAWSGHRFEVVELRAGARNWVEVEQATRDILRPVRILRTPEGGLAVWHPAVEPEDSISRRLENHDLMWLQPMRVRDGWEHYDAISFGPEGEQAALDELRQQHPTQVVRRRSIGPEDVAAALFLSLHPVLEAPTAKQAEALAAAGSSGYYESPRNATTAEVASLLGIGRSAFEERLRGGENRIMAALLPALGWYRVRDEVEARRQHVRGN